MELSDNAINILSGMPKSIEMDRNDLGRFFNDYNKNINIENVIVNNEVQIDIYKQKILPFILEGLGHIKRKQPQGYKIYIVGELQSVTNLDILIRLIHSKIGYKNFYGIESLSASKQSYFAFISFFDTTEHFNGDIYRLTGGTKRKHTYYFTRQGLHFYINYNNILVTITDGEDFSQTKTISIGVHQFIKSILNIENISIELIQNYIDSLKQSH